MNNYDIYCCFRNNSEGVRILWELTTRCNQSCSFCHVTPKKELEFSQFVEIFEKLFTVYNIRDIILSGGEPFVRRDIFQIIKYVHDRGVNVDLCTNATLIDDKIAQMLKESLTEISVSLNRVSNDYYNKRTINGIKNLVKHGMSVHLICTVTKKNFKYLNKIAAIAEELAVHSLTYLGLVESRIYDISEIDNNVLSEEELKEVRESIKLCRKKYDKLIINTKRIFEKNPKEYCGAGQNILGVTSDGHLCPCILHQDEYYLDLLDCKTIENNIQFPHYCSCIS